VALVHARHLLQEHQVRLERGAAFAQVVDHDAAIELRQPLVDVQRYDAQASPSSQVEGKGASRTAR